MDGRIGWRDLFDERQNKEVEFCRLYAESFAHGTDGHNAKLIIAKLAALLDQLAGHEIVDDIVRVEVVAHREHEQAEAIYRRQA